MGNTNYKCNNKYISHYTFDEHHKQGTLGQAYKARYGLKNIDGQYRVIGWELRKSIIIILDKKSQCICIWLWGRHHRKSTYQGCKEDNIREFVMSNGWKAGSEPHSACGIVPQRHSSGLSLAAKKSRGERLYI